MFDYAALAALAAVIREGSFERAAQSLHVTPSAVSQRIRSLEERVGCALVVRGQPCQATDTYSCQNVAFCADTRGLPALSNTMIARLGQALAIDCGISKRSVPPAGGRQAGTQVLVALYALSSQSDEFAT